MKSIKDDNRGITLVELIVSITILAIIVLPLLNAFVTSSKTNAKSKDEMNATDLATNIMEGLERDSLKEVAYQFNYPSEGFNLVDIGDTGDTCELILVPNGGNPYFNKAIRFEEVKSEVSNKDEVISSSIHKKVQNANFKDSSKWKFVDSASHKYYFYMSDIKSGNKKYNALITIDGSASNINSPKYKYNNQDMVADMSAMDSKYDAISSDKMTANDVVLELDSKYSGIKQKDITRTITVDVTKTTHTVVKVSYSYSFKYDGKKVVFPAPNSLEAEDYTSVVYDSSDLTDDAYLRNVYLFYQPWYTSVSTTGYAGCTDVIKINNKDNLDFTMNIIKQNCVDPSYLYSYEKNYDVFVDMVETGSNTQKAHMNIATNLNVNLANPQDQIKPTQAIYRYNNNVNQNQVNNLVKIGSLNREEVSDRYFDVTVDIYDSSVSYSNISGATAVVSLTGSMVE